MSRKTGHSLLLALASLIWGIAFVAQRTGGEAVGAFSFNSVRNLIGSAVLLPVIRWLNHKKDLKNSTAESGKQEKADLWIGGICCGIALFFASNMQQLALNLGASVGKAGFLTACYILMVPILGIFFHKKCPFTVWFGVALTMFGLYLLCMKDTSGFSYPDYMLLLCAFLFSIQILCVDHFAEKCDGVKLACIEFFVCGLIGIFPTLFYEVPKEFGSYAVWLQTFADREVITAILYAGVLSSGVAYTLQIVGQKEVNPTIASLIMSFESVFCALAGVVILGERMTAKEVTGCVIMFTAVLIAQMPVKGKEI